MSEAAASVEPTSNDTPFVTDAVRLARVLFSPGAVYAEVQNRPTFWRPWLVVSVIYAVINYFQRPFQQKLAGLMIERAGRTAPPDTMVKALISAALTPVGVLVMCVISAAILYGLVSAMGGETTFKKMLTVVIFTWPIVLIQTAITVAVLTSRGLASITTPSDMMVSLGLDLLLPADATVGYFLRFVLAGIGPLAVWGLIIAAVGLTILGKVGKGGAWTAAIIHFLIILCGLSALGAFGMKMMAGVSQ